MMCGEGIRARKLGIETKTQMKSENLRKYFESMMWKIDRGIMYVRDIAAIQICKICLMCRKFIAFLVNWASKCQHTLY